MKKNKCNVVMLATEKDSNLFIGDLSNSLHYNHSIEKGNSINQNLYITSSDEIKESDYAILNNERIIKVGKNWSEQINKESLKEYSKKIIATTDSELHKDGVNKINLSFIEKYIERYNNKTPIEWVNVEYENQDMDFDPSETNGIKWVLKPKLCSDSTIIIHKVQEVFTKDDMKKAYNEGYFMYTNFETWFEQNY